MWMAGCMDGADLLNPGCSWTLHARNIVDGTSGDLGVARGSVTV